MLRNNIFENLFEFKERDRVNVERKNTFTRSNFNNDLFTHLIRK